jgi:GNAT superfamily N-acetyltransferase
MRYRWPSQTQFHEWIMVPEDRQCEICGGPQHICDHRHHRFFTLHGPVHLVSKLCRCPNSTCAGHHVTVSPSAELSVTMPWWLIGWDVFAWMGQRRFARHWSVPQIRAELCDSYQVRISDDAIEDYLHRYQTMVAARHQDPTEMARAYQGANDLILSIDGLQPEKGHETLYVVRELRRRRVWFAEPLLSSGAEEVRRLLEQARDWAQRLGLPVRLWISDKQDAFVSGIAQVFAGVPHRYCENHFLRDLAKPVLEADSKAKVVMRRKVRGLRSIERDVLSDSPETTEAGGNGVVLDYCAAVRGVLNDDHGGPLQPPGLKMAEALSEIRSSLQRNLEAKKGGRRRSDCSG